MLLEIVSTRVPVSNPQPQTVIEYRDKGLTIRAALLNIYTINGAVLMLVQPQATWLAGAWHDMPADCPFEVSADVLVGQGV